MVALSTEQEFEFFLEMGNILHGWGLAEQDQREEGIMQIRQGLAVLRDQGTKLFWTYWLALLTEAYERVGQAEEGLVVLLESLDAVHKHGECFYEAELYRLKGELLLTVSAENQAEAETCFRQAIDVARQQCAKSLELRAVTSLSRLWQKLGRKEEARKMLAEIYGWFTEGFDTRDLKQAKVLLEEL
jgi:predicted ATPase